MRLFRLLNPFKKPDFETIAMQGQGVIRAFCRIAKDVIRDYAESA